MGEHSQQTHRPDLPHAHSLLATSATFWVLPSAQIGLYVARRQFHSIGCVICPSTPGHLRRCFSISIPCCSQAVSSPHTFVSTFCPFKAPTVGLQERKTLALVQSHGGDWTNPLPHGRLISVVLRLTECFTLDWTWPVGRHYVASISRRGV